MIPYITKIQNIFLINNNHEFDFIFKVQIGIKRCFTTNFGISGLNREICAEKNHFMQKLDLLHWRSNLSLNHLK